MAVKSNLVRRMLEEEYEFEIPTSMIDVVFLLLIFFLAATKFKVPENKLDVELPKDAGINPIPTEVIPPREYRVKVDGRDETKYLFMLDNLEVSSQPELVQKLTIAAKSSPQLSVVIVGQKDTPFLYIVWALDACKQARIDDVKFEGFDVPGMGQASRDG
ncbi:MAG: biopolymer transporter ExbD [Planctomycetes bacterium]|nr:biopolymer transporter ExbD [Planctomycetota bacterium]